MIASAHVPDVNHPFDARPIVVAIAGPNGAGKSTFYEAFLARAGLRFINADDIARALQIDAYDAATLAESMRNQCVIEGVSFVFKTVFSDPVGAKVEFLAGLATRGYTVVLCFIGLDSAAVSDERVTMRVLQGGHDVPPEKVSERYPRSLSNLTRAIDALPHVWVYDNSDLAHPFRKVAQFENGKLARAFPPAPAWLAL